MKLYLTIDDNFVVPPDYIKVGASQLINVPNGTCDEIYCDVLEYIENKTDYISMLITKIKYGGIVTILGNDLYKICQHVTYGKLDIATAKTLLYNKRIETNIVFEIKQLLSERGLKIIQSNSSDYEFIIRAQR